MIESVNANNNTTTKLLAVKYPTALDRAKNNLDNLYKLVDVVDVNSIKNLIGELLFDNRWNQYNYCIIQHNNKYYVIDPLDYDKRTYSRKEVNPEFHPLSHLLK